MKLAIPGRKSATHPHQAARKTAKPPPVKESPIVAWLAGAAIKQAIAKAARSLAEGKSENVIAQVGSLGEENALLKSDNAVLRIEIASLAKRLDKVRAGRDQERRLQGAEQRGLRVQQPSEHHRRDSRSQPTGIAHTAPPPFRQLGGVGGFSTG